MSPTFGHVARRAGYVRPGCGAAQRFGGQRAVADGIVTPPVSTPLFLEHEDVLTRAGRPRAMAMTEDSMDGFLSALASASEAVELHYKWRP